MIELLVGMNVLDDRGYAMYRAEMTPILATFGGAFGVDVRVSEVLKGPQPMNRLFTLRFPSEEQADAFFANPAYLAVRERYFTPSVGEVHRLGRFRAG